MYKTNYSSNDIKLRLEARIKNADLVGARETLDLSQKEVARRIGIYQEKLCSLENMRFYPNKKLQTKICEFYRKNGVFLLEEDVFPEELKFVKRTKYVAERNIPKPELISLSNLDTKLLPTVYNEAIEKISRVELRDELNLLLSKLPYRQTEILKLRFGLDGQNPLTLEEIAKIFNVTAERIRQIEAKAIRSIRDPNKLRRLREFIQI